MEKSKPTPGQLSKSQSSSHPPITSYVLNAIGRADFLERCQNNSGFFWDDELFPYGEDQLPKDEAADGDPLGYVKQFVDKQNKHLSETSLSLSGICDALESKKKNKPHIPVSNIEDIFQFIDILGSGRFGKVIKVRLKTDDIGYGGYRIRNFALKLLRKPTLRGSSNRRSTVQEFKTELQHLRKCDHTHMLEFKASFTDQNDFGILLLPVTERNLQHVLDEIIQENNLYTDNKSRKSLERAIGCLLEAVRYLHENLSIRHRDLKPSNILVAQHGKVIICDFGSAYDWEPADLEESTERSQAGTRKYKAPEVRQDINIDPPPRHNRSADIFSLGCVFLEILTVLSGETLDDMARYTTDENLSYAENWDYSSSLEGVGRWVKKIQQYEDNGIPRPLADMIINMLAKDRNERRSANDLLIQVRTHHQKFIGECCLSHNIELQPTLPHDLPSESMKYSSSRPIKACKIGRREHKSRYGPYEFFTDFEQLGELEIREHHTDRVPWGTTYSIIITYSALEEYWLPAYFVQAAWDGPKATIRWSECGQQLIEKVTNGRICYSRVHCRGPRRTNMLMEVEFQHEPDARGLCTLLMTEPIDEQKILHSMRLPDSRRVTIYDVDWKSDHHLCGSRVLSFLDKILDYPTKVKYRRLEPLYIPHDADFSWALLEDQKHIDFKINGALTVRYRSNQDTMWEIEEEKARFEGVELVAISQSYCIRFEEESISVCSNGKPCNKGQSQHVECTESSENTLQVFLSKLTGWEFLAAFRIRKARHVKKLLSTTRDRADSICFRNKNTREIQLAIRCKDANGESFWTTAKLSHLNGVRPEEQELEIELVNRQEGATLCLASITAAGKKRMASRDDCEKWIFMVEENSAIPVKYNHSFMDLARDIDPKINYARREP